MSFGLTFSWPRDLGWPWMILTLNMLTKGLGWYLEVSQTRSMSLYWLKLLSCIIDHSQWFILFAVFRLGYASDRNIVSQALDIPVVIQLPKSILVPKIQSPFQFSYRRPRVKPSVKGVLQWIMQFIYMQSAAHLELAAYLLVVPPYTLYMPDKFGCDCISRTSPVTSDHTCCVIWKADLCSSVTPSLRRLSGPKAGSGRLITQLKTSPGRCATGTQQAAIQWLLPQQWTCPEVVPIDNVGTMQCLVLWFFSLYEI